MVHWQVCGSRTDMFSGLSSAGHLLSLGPSIVLICNQADSYEWGCMVTGGGGAKTPLPEWPVTSNLRVEVIGTCRRGGGGRAVDAGHNLP